jgi:hypothetical protein
MRCRGRQAQSVNLRAVSPDLRALKHSSNAKPVIQNERIERYIYIFIDLYKSIFRVISSFVVSGACDVMNGAVRNWRVGLVEAYPDLFRPPAGALEGAEGSPDCGQGWRDLLERACVRIRAAVQADGGSFKATQIKEKFGSLRFYWDGALSPEAVALVEEAVDLAEARSACTCEICGAEGRLHYRGGWLATACAEHARGEPVPVRPGCENVHVVRQVVEGRVRIISCRRYDRDADAFVDVDPDSLGIEE